MLRDATDLVQHAIAVPSDQWQYLLSSPAFAVGIFREMRPFNAFLNEVLVGFTMPSH